MASQPATTTDRLVIDAKWRKLPMLLLVIGGIAGLAAVLFGNFDLRRQFAYSYLLAFMFFLSLCLGGLFLVIIHHLFDAAWSVPIRRVTEHMACLLPVMAVLFIPIAIMAKPLIYSWMQAPATDHALHAKQPIFTMPGFYIIAVVLFAIWSWLSLSLRRNSLNQDKDGAAIWTYKMRKLSAGGIYLFAFTLTLAAIMWMKALEYQWFSTMYGVYYFAASVWTTLATVYLITRLLQRTGPLSGVVHTRQIHDLGMLLFTFTVFYAYIHFSQYFLIWNAAIPEETFYYVKREFGTWWQVCLVLVFGHFFLPFLLLLRIDAKMALPLMIPLCVWVWMMHFLDMSFNIMPLIHKANFVLHPLDIACMMFFAGVLSLVFIKFFNSHPPYPVKDPRLGEALGVHHAGARAPIAAAD
jgi:hypothetical protein